MKDQKQTVDISYESIIKVVAVILGLFFLFYLRDVIFILLVSIILSLIVVPAVDSLEKKKIPRVVGAFALFSASFLIMGLIIYLVAPPLAKELSQLASKLPYYLGDDIFSVNQQFFNYELSDPLQKILTEISGSLKNIASSVFLGLFSFLGGFVSAMLIIVISFYLAIEENGIERFVKAIVPPKLRLRILKIIGKIQLKLGRWFIGQLSLGFIVGAMSLAGLYLLGVPYALVLAIIAGIFELIPYLGPALSAIPAIIIALTVSPTLAILTLVLYFLIQQFENYLIVPKVMEKSVNLHPVVTIIAVIVGGKLAGITGAILAIPIATIASIILEDFYTNKENVN